MWKRLAFKKRTVCPPPWDGSEHIVPNLSQTTGHVMITARVCENLPYMSFHFLFGAAFDASGR
jgi:hypothetical protein